MDGDAYNAWFSLVHDMLHMVYYLRIVSFDGIKEMVYC